MIQRQRQSLFGKRPAGRSASSANSLALRPDHTVPGIPPPRLLAAEEPTILGFPADDETGSGALPALEPAPPPEAAVEHQIRVVALPRADPLAGIALVLAGIAAAGSLVLPWREGQPETGSSLVRTGLAAVGSGSGDIGHSGLWEPPVIVIGGALLLLLGVLLFLPARTHRVVGVMALLVAAGVCTALLFRVGGLGWVTERFGPGLWLGVAVAGLGVLGALKAMLTVPRVTVKRRRAAEG
jgi:hypothetical protein